MCRTLLLILLALFLVSPGARAASSYNDVESSGPIKDSVAKVLNSSRAVPYLKDGKVSGYIIQSDSEDKLEGPPDPNDMLNLENGLAPEQTANDPVPSESAAQE